VCCSTPLPASPSCQVGHPVAKLALTSKINATLALGFWRGRGEGGGASQSSDLSSLLPSFLPDVQAMGEDMIKMCPESISGKISLSPFPPFPLPPLPLKKKCATRFFLVNYLCGEVAPPFHYPPRPICGPLLLPCLLHPSVLPFSTPFHFSW
jgi:hypothetical protein